MVSRRSFWKPVLIAAAVAVFIGVLGGTLTDTGIWYQSLLKPSWQPPDWLFGPAWTLIFALATASAVHAWRHAESRVQRDWVIGLFALNGCLNVLWSTLFFALRRPDWALIEEPIELARVLRESARAEQCLLVDCLTLWLTNLLMLEDDARLVAEREELLECLGQLPGRIILVSNESGLGVVPMGELTRRYVDEAGWLHQAIAERCQRVVFTVAGLPMLLKGAPL